MTQEYPLQIWSVVNGWVIWMYANYVRNVLVFVFCFIPVSDYRTTRSSLRQSMKSYFIRTGWIALKACAMNCRRKETFSDFPCMYQYIGAIDHAADAGFSPWRPGFNPRWLHLRFRVDQVTRIKFPSQFLRFLPASHHFTIGPPPEVWDSPYQAAPYHILGL
jgi:hypothetical protein